MSNQVTDLGFDKPFVPKPDNEYDKAARAFLERNKIKFAFTKKGDKCPLFCDGKHTHGDRYVIRFSRIGWSRDDMHPTNRTWSFSFWNSLRDSQNGFDPEPYDALTCITKSDPGSFADFCGDLGYDEDSRKAEKTYKAVVREWEAVQNFFTEKEIVELQEIQ